MEIYEIVLPEFGTSESKPDGKLANAPELPLISAPE